MRKVDEWEKASKRANVLGEGFHVTKKKAKTWEKNVFVHLPIN